MRMCSEAGYFTLFALFALVGSSVAQITYREEASKCEYRLRIDSSRSDLLITVLLDTVPDEAGISPRASSIQIASPNGTQALQTLTVPCMFVSFSPQQFQTQDFNFDGFPDLSLEYNSSSGGSDSHVWLYDPRRHRFKYSAELSDLTDLFADTSTHTLISTYGSGACCGTTSTYRLGHGKLILLKEEITTFDDNLQRRVVTTNVYRRNRLVSSVVDTLVP